MGDVVNLRRLNADGSPHPGQQLASKRRGGKPSTTKPPLDRRSRLRFLYVGQFDVPLDDQLGKPIRWGEVGRSSCRAGAVGAE